MGWLLKTLLVLWGVYAVGIVWFMRKVLNEHLAYLRKMDPETNIKYSSAARHDMLLLEPWKIYLGAVFVMPVRFIFSVPLHLLVFILVLPMKYIYGMSQKTTQKPMGGFFYFYMVGMFKILNPFLLRCMGITSVVKRKLRINDVIANYRPIQDTKHRAPIYVSNHVSAIDQYYFMDQEVSFVAKAAVAKIPCFNILAFCRQCLFIERESKEKRDQMMDAIRTRAERVRTHGDVPSVFIFPEGTTGNGNTLLSFKKGAFATGDRIKIFCLKYNSIPLAYTMSIANAETIYSMLLSMSQLRNTVEVIEFEDAFDPQWVYATKNIKPDDEHAWEEVAKVVKSLIMFAGNFHSTEETFRDHLELMKSWPELNAKALGRHFEAAK